MCIICHVSYCLFQIPLPLRHASITVCVVAGGAGIAAARRRHGPAAPPADGH